MCLSPTFSTEREPVRSTLESRERNKLTFAQSKNPDLALLTPSIRKVACGLMALSESDGSLESWKFWGQAEQCRHILPLHEDDAEVEVIDAVGF
jgi:hypothetical protein